MELASAVKYRSRTLMDQGNIERLCRREVHLLTEKCVRKLLVIGEVL